MVKNIGFAAFCLLLKNRIKILDKMYKTIFAYSLTEYFFFFLLFVNKNFDQMHTDC